MSCELPRAVKPRVLLRVSCELPVAPASTPHLHGLAEPEQQCLAVAVAVAVAVTVAVARSGRVCYSAEVQANLAPAKRKDARELPERSCPIEPEMSNELEGDRALVRASPDLT